MAVGLRVVVSMVRTLESNDAGASCANDAGASCANSVRSVSSYLAERNKFKKLCLPFALLMVNTVSMDIYLLCYIYTKHDFTVKLSEPYRKMYPPPCTSGSRHDPYSSTPTNTMRGIRAHRL